MNSNAPNFNPSGGGYAYQGGGGYDNSGYYEETPQENPYGGGRGEEYYPETGYYPQEQQQQQPSAYGTQHYDDPSYVGEGGYGDGTAYGTEWNATGNAGYTVPEMVPGCYYPDAQLPEIMPQVFGAPVTAISYDHDFAAIYVASASQSDRQPHRGSPAQHRSAMMATHSTSDGALYSAVAGHPEAPASVLTTIYSSLYDLNSSLSQNRRHVPSHAYRPPYATTLPSSLLESPMKNSYQMGITGFVPLSGYVASVSPAAVRLHASGGFQVADLDVEGMLAATAHPHDGGLTTHITVGGLVKNQRDSPLLCLDLYQGLKTVSTGRIDGVSSRPVSVTALATSNSKGSIVAGCSDGYVRLYDGRLRSLASIKSHLGGVVDVTVSADGNLVATTGYGPSSPISTPLYAYPDPTVSIYDIRYLGRGGFPHAFAGMRGGPRFVSFLPDHAWGDSTPSNRLLVASGQAGGGMQIIVPFEEPASNSSASNFLLPPLERNESVSNVCVTEDRLAIGTSQGRILQYKMADYQAAAASLPKAADNGVFTPSRQGAKLLNSRSTSGSTPVEKQQLEMPPFEPPPPQVSLSASLLSTEHPDARLGPTDQIKAIMSAYTLGRQPQVSALGSVTHGTDTSYGPLASRPMVSPGRLEISPKLLSKVAHTVDFLQTIPTSDLDIDIMEDHRPTRLKSKDRRNKDPLPNANKLIFSSKLFSVAYKKTLNRRNYAKRNLRDREDDQEEGDGSFVNIPERYRLNLRPSHKSVAAFNHGDANKSGFLPGWDYPPTMPNAFVPPVLSLLYFFPEVYALAAQTPVSDRSVKDKRLIPELGGLFHRIDSLAKYAMLFSTAGGGMTSVGVWAPSSFIACLSTMPEAEQLQILDGSPEAISSPRRPEAFFRFLLHQLDKEGTKISSMPRMLDLSCGISFTSVNEFISGSGPPSKSTTRALTLDMNYDPFLSPETNDDQVFFSDVLQYNLCRENRLRAWNQQSKAYETIVQRKIATSLPAVLTLSCACAGRKEEEGLCLWRGRRDQGHWLPEMLEIELDETGLVIVRELVVDEKSGNETWRECRGKGSIPSSVSKLIASVGESSTPTTRRYRLDAVIFWVRDDMDKNCPEEIQGDDDQFGHHALHIRVPKATKRRILMQQLQEIEEYLSADLVENVSNMTKTGLSSDWTVFEKRRDYAKSKLEALDSDPSDSSWLLVNGFLVVDTFVEDARAFGVKFKEPSLVVYRTVDDAELSLINAQNEVPKLPTDVMKTISITNSSKSQYAQNQRADSLPGTGELVAFDAEFVSVQDEESTISESGSKVTVREMRHALGRISAINCKHRSVIFDDHVLPREKVVDCLTRFSGIVAQDLNPKQSSHHLIGPWAAYLKLRCLLERGCVFVGHGLQQDFWTANLAVPDSQIIDTVEIYHKPAQRYISLRFLTNFVLKRDMQQDIHDSIEDALAAYELYVRAVELKQKGEFEALLDDLYAYGQKTDWKLGMDTSAHKTDPANA